MKFSKEYDQANESFVFRTYDSENENIVWAKITYTTSADLYDVHGIVFEKFFEKNSENVLNDFKYHGLKNQNREFTFNTSRDNNHDLSYRFWIELR